MKDFKELFQKISKKEWYFIGLVSLFLIIMTGAPYLYAWINTPPGDVYLGNHNLTPGDTYVYFSYAKQAEQGHLLFKDLYTSESQGRTIFIPYFLAFGLLAKIFSISFPVLHQLVRLCLIPIFIAVLYLFIVLFFNHKKWRQAALIFTVFASGISAYFYDLFIQRSELYDRPGYFHAPMDLWVSESNIFLTLYHNPLYIVALILIVLIFIISLIAFKNRNLKYAFWVGILSLFLFINHPYHPPTIYGVLGIYALYMIISQRQKIIKLIAAYSILVLVSLPAIIYYLYLIFKDPIMNYKMTIQGGPAFPLTAVSYGLLFLFAIFGTWLAATKRVNKNEEINKEYLSFVVIWFLTSFILIHFDFLRHPRRLSLGLQIPISLLSVVFFIYVFDLLRMKSKRIAAILAGLPKGLFLIFFVIFFSFSGLVIWLSDISLFASQNNSVYLSRPTYEGMEYLNNLDDKAVLASVFHGNLIPGISGRTVYIGHDPETILFNDKVLKVKWFFQDNKNDEKRLDFLINNNIGYLFWSADEERYGSFSPEKTNFLEEVYRNSEVKIYKVL